MRSIVSITVALAALSLSACGSSARHRAAPKRADAPHALTPAEISCTAPTRAAMASYLHILPSAITESASVGNNDEPQCMFRARLAARRKIALLVNVDNSPSPYFRLLRTNVENSQGFPALNHQPPSAVFHLGLEADWFPQIASSPELMTTDGYRLITVEVMWSHEPQRDQRTLAIRMARPFLHTPHGKVAAAIARDYP